VAPANAPTAIPITPNNAPTNAPTVAPIAAPEIASVSRSLGVVIARSPCRLGNRAGAQHTLALLEGNDTAIFCRKLILALT
jgi:hypothetical protein